MRAIETARVCRMCRAGGECQHRQAIGTRSMVWGVLQMRPFRVLQSRSCVLASVRRECGCSSSPIACARECFDRTPSRESQCVCVCVDVSVCVFDPWATHCTTSSTITSPASDRACASAAQTAFVPNWSDTVQPSIDPSSSFSCADCERSRSSLALLLPSVRGSCGWSVALGMFLSLERLGAH